MYTEIKDQEHVSDQQWTDSQCVAPKYTFFKDTGSCIATVTSLDEAKAACNSLSGCNALNYNPQTKQAVLLKNSTHTAVKLGWDAYQKNNTCLYISLAIGAGLAIAAVVGVVLYKRRARSA